MDDSKSMSFGYGRLLLVYRGHFMPLLESSNRNYRK